MKLVIVESPAKCKTIGKYLGNDYKVMASYGHIRDLATTGKGGLGVDIEHDFAPHYIEDKTKAKIITSLEKEAQKASEVLLATDPDREGEAIAWHLAEVLHLPVDQTKRLEFHEITRPAIQNAIEHPRTINMDLVESQECRRILDRIMGFKLTGLLKKKIKMESAGRVQSAALKLIVDHEKEIEAFVPEEYWTIQGSLSVMKKELPIKLDKIDGKQSQIHNEQEAQSILDELPSAFKVDSVIKKAKKKEPKSPFITSTLQQEAFNRYKFSTKKTASIAQKLYEGKTIGDEITGLITYMRTDSARLSLQFVESAEKYILENYGEAYLGKVHIAKQKGQVQDAHEAIRPTSLKRTPEMMKEYLSRDEYQLYKMIYYRTLASLMKASEYEVTTILMNIKNYVFKAEGETLVFDGYEKIYRSAEDEEKTNTLPKVEEGATYDVKEMTKEQHFTKAPAHYSEAKVVKLMEELGIGRPSTYASTIQILLKRKYVESESGYLIPTREGKITADYLDKYFLRLINTTFTAEMEEDLDSVMRHKETRLHLLKSFYDLFMPIYEAAVDGDYTIPIPEETYGTCPECGSALVKKHGAYGDFIACSNYPKCKYKVVEKKEAPKPTGELCPKCGHEMVYRKNKKGEVFEACSNYPHCHYIKGAEPKERIVIKKCPDCGGDLILKPGVRGRSPFLGCSNYPRCKHIEKYEPKDEKENG